MRQLVTRSLASATAATVLVGRPAAARPWQVAVPVGVKAYDGPAFEPLKFAERDLTRPKWLFDAAGHRVTLLLGSSEGDGQVTRADIHRVLLDKVRVALRGVTQDATVERVRSRAMRVAAPRRGGDGTATAEITGVREVFHGSFLA